jgi:hypothetical protein
MALDRNAAGGELVAKQHPLPIRHLTPVLQGDLTYLDPVSAKGERTSAALALEKAREIIFIFNISVSRETASRETFR